MECYEGKERDIKERGTCENCGSEFRPSSRGKTCLCEKCYNKHRRINKTNTMRLLRCGHEIPSPL